MSRNVGVVAVMVMLVALAAPQALANGVYDNVLLSIKADTQTITGFGSSVNNEDIMSLLATSFDPVASGTWSRTLQGSAKGIAAAANIDGIDKMANGDLLIGFGATSVTLNGNTFDCGDVAKLHAGALSMFFDGSAHGLTRNINDIAVWNNSLIIAPGYNGSVTGIASFTANDLLKFVPDCATNMNGTGTWSLFMKGTGIGFNTSSEYFNGVSVVDNAGNPTLPTVFLSVITDGAGFNLAAGGLVFNNEDIVKLIPTSLGSTTSGIGSLWMRGNSVGLTTATDGLGVQAFYVGADAVPEPATLLFLGTGIVSLIGWRVRRRLR